MVENCRLIQCLMVFVLVGGCGSCLKELIDCCVKLVVYFGGKVCIIDFVLFNVLNFGICKMLIVIQYKVYLLIWYCQCGWNFFCSEWNEFLDILFVF